MPNLPMGVIALLDKALEVVRAALVDWSGTARFCLTSIVVATMICVTAVVLHS